MSYEETMHDLHVHHMGTIVPVMLPNGGHIMGVIEDITKDYDSCDYDPDDFDEESYPAHACRVLLGTYPDNYQKAMHIEVSPHDLVLEPPKVLGNYEVGDLCLFGSRIGLVDSPAKYRTTLGKRSLNLNHYNQEECRALSLWHGQLSLIMPYLSKAYSNSVDYRTIDDAVYQLRRGKRLGCALSYEYSMHISADSDDLIIAKQGMVIGTYDVIKKVVVLAHDLEEFKEELNELGFEVLIEAEQWDEPTSDRVAAFKEAVARLGQHEFTFESFLEAVDDH